MQMRFKGFICTDARMPKNLSRCWCRCRSI